MLMQAWSPRLRPAARALRKLLNADLIAEPRRYCFLPDLPVKPKARNVYMRGWWQAAGYAQAVAARLHSELALRQVALGSNAEVLGEIFSCENAVSIHLRRGDYAQWENGSFLLPLAYYHAAIRRLVETTTKPRFFIFSDDMQFARENLPDNVDRVFVGHNTAQTGYEDLRLMSACRHNIIANSSFSWWAAWLNRNPQKIVIAPKFWLCRPDSYYPDLFPADWTLLDNL